MITTVVGNYPKISTNPKAPNLRAAIAKLDAGKSTQGEIHRVEDEATREVIKEQEKAGIDLVTDGQIRWEDGLTYFAKRIQGFTINGLIRYFDTNTYYRQPIIQGKLAWPGPISVKDFQFAKSCATKGVKAVMPGPYSLGRLSQNTSSSDLKTIVMELASILNQEAKELDKAGAQYIQFDEPAILKYKGDFTLFRDASRVLTKGIKAKTALCLYFRDISGLYPELFTFPFQVFSLDFVMGKANFEIIKDFPKDKELGLGIIDARNTKIETVEQIVADVKRVSSIVPISRLHIHPTCGLEFLPRKNAYDKLLRLVEGGRRAKEVLA